MLRAVLKYSALGSLGVIAGPGDRPQRNRLRSHGQSSLQVRYELVALLDSGFKLPYAVSQQIVLTSPCSNFISRRLECLPILAGLGLCFPSSPCLASSCCFGMVSLNLRIAVRMGSWKR